MQAEASSLILAMSVAVEDQGLFKMQVFSSDSVHYNMNWAKIAL
jgi:hypothetical protein